MGGAAAESRRSSGAPASATTSRARSRRRSSRRATTLPPQPIIHKDGIGRARCRRPTAGSQEGPFRYAGIDDHYFVSMVLNDRNAAVPHRLRAVGRSADRQPGDRRPLRRLFGALPVAAGSVAVLLWAESVRGPSRDQSRSDARHQLRHVLVAGGAAARRAEVGARLHRQLGLGDRRPDAAHQPRAVPAAAQERGLDAQDAGDPAADEGDPGSLRQIQGHRSGTAEDEHRGDGAVQGEGRQPGQRLRADAADVPVPVCLLRDAVAGDRDSRRRLHGLDPQPVGAGSLLRPAGR